MKATYANNWAYFEFRDPGDPSFSLVIDYANKWYDVWINEERKRRNLDLDNRSFFFLPPSSDFFKFKGYMNVMNHYLEGCDAGDISVTNSDLIIDLMVHFNVGDPVYFKLKYYTNEKQSKS